MSHSKCSKKSLKPLKDELKDYRKQGVRLFLNGNPSTPKCIAKACMIAEDGGYMRDYTAIQKVSHKVLAGQHYPSNISDSDMYLPYQVEDISDLLTSMRVLP